jgi:hypothetical protein
MSDHQPDHGQQDRRGIPAISHYSAKDRSPAQSERQPAADSISVPFQLVADFVVEAKKTAEYLLEPDLGPQERSLFLAIITTPEALNRICRFAIVCDLTEDSERYFKGKFMGPETEDIFASILPYLPVELQNYWTGLQRECCDCFESCIDSIFEQFRSSLRKTEIIDVTTGESIPLWANSKIQAESWSSGHLSL